MSGSVRRVSEAELTVKAMEYLRYRNWLYTHFVPARMASGRWVTALQGDKGFVDIVAARNGVVKFIELKVGKNKLEPMQVTWRNALPAEHYMLIYPENFGELVEAMR